MSVYCIDLSGDLGKRPRASDVVHISWWSCTVTMVIYVYICICIYNVLLCTRYDRKKCTMASVAALTEPLCSARPSASAQPQALKSQCPNLNIRKLPETIAHSCVSVEQAQGSQELGVTFFGWVPVIIRTTVSGGLCWAPHLWKLPWDRLENLGDVYGF